MQQMYYVTDEQLQMMAKATASLSIKRGLAIWNTLEALTKQPIQVQNPPVVNATPDKQTPSSSKAPKKTKKI